MYRQVIRGLAGGASALAMMSSAAMAQGLQLEGIVVTTT